MRKNGVPAIQVFPLPEGLDDAMAAALVNPVYEAFAAEAIRGIDVVIDYLWGRPTEPFLEASTRGFRASPTRSTRLVELGESAGKAINLPGAILRSIDLKLLGSGFGSASLDLVLGAIPDFFSLAAAGTLTIDVKHVPLSEFESALNRVEKGRRIVFRGVGLDFPRDRNGTPTAFCSPHNRS